MPIKYYITRFFGVLGTYVSTHAPKGLAAGFLAASSMFPFFAERPDAALIKDFVAEITTVMAAVREWEEYSPKGLGEHYQITGETTYEVREGDNVYTIAAAMKRRGVWIKPKQIVEWNNLIPPHYYLKPGTILTLYNLSWDSQLVEASWYGPGFHGKPMANTKIFDQNDIVAAHMYLPLGMRVRVTNVENGMSLEIPVTDRGNFEKYNRGIDLSKQAAVILGYHGAGTAQVLVEPLP